MSKQASIEQVLQYIEDSLDDVLTRPRAYGDGGSVEGVTYQFLQLRHFILHPDCAKNCVHNAYSNVVSNKYHTCMALSGHLKKLEPDYQKYYLLLCEELKRIRVYCSGQHPIPNIMVADDGTVWTDDESSPKTSNGNVELVAQKILDGEAAEALKRKLPPL